MAWQDILGDPGVKSALVVAHNAVNQALLNTALDLPPSFFRRLLPEQRSHQRDRLPARMETAPPCGP